MKPDSVGSDALTSDFATTGFHHITMVAHDIRRTVTFYADILGFDLVKRTVNFDAPSSYHLYFGTEAGRPGTILTFFEWPDAPKGGWGVGGVHHVALSVPTYDGLLQWKRRLTDRGIEVSGPLDRGYFQSLYFKDPDGQILEIATAGPGYAIDEPADQLGQELVTPPDERLSEGRDTRAIAALTWPEPVPDVSSEIALTGIHHVSAITGDLSAAGDFYEEALGLKVVKRTFNQDDGKTKHYFWAAYDGETVRPGSSMTLFGWEGSEYHARPGAGQTHHVAFRAPDADSQAAWREHLLGMGLNVSPVMDRCYFESIYFRAPDGLLVEIATDGPGFGIDEPTDALGRELQLPPWLEAERAGITSSLTPLD